MKDNKTTDVYCNVSTTARDLISAHEATKRAISNYNDVTRKSNIAKELSGNLPQAEHKSR